MYKVYELAGVPFGVNFNFEYTLNKNKDYETTKSPLFNITIEEKDIQLEREVYLKQNGEDFNYATAYLEHTAIYRKFTENAINENVVLFHGSAIEYKNRAYLFVAPSGTGKSTHVKLINEVYKGEVSYINDDKPLLKIENGEVYVYGSPWDGKHHYSNNVKVKLGAICILNRGAENKIEKIDKSVSAIKLLAFSYCPKNEQAVKTYFNLLEKIVEHPVYNLYCNINLDAPKLSISTMSKECE